MPAASALPARLSAHSARLWSRATTQLKHAELGLLRLLRLQHRMDGAYLPATAAHMTAHCGIARPKDAPRHQGMTNPTPPARLATARGARTPPRKVAANHQISSLCDIEVLLNGLGWALDGPSAPGTSGYRN